MTPLVISTNQSSLVTPVSLSPSKRGPSVNAVPQSTPVNPIVSAVHHDHENPQIGDDDDQEEIEDDDDLLEDPDYEEEQDNFESEDEQQENSLFVPDNSGLALRRLAEAERMSDEDEVRIRAALEATPTGDEFAEKTLSLLEAIDKKGHISLVKEHSLRKSDILCIACVKDRENSAWFTEGLIDTLVALEGNTVPDVHLETDLSHFLEEAYVEGSLSDDIEKASNGEDPLLGFPFVDMKQEHTRILGIVNPTRSHWITYEYLDKSQTRTGRNTLRYYTSLPTSKNRGPTYRAVTHIIPQLLYLASFRTGSPLSGFDPHALEVESASCPEQANSYDCGPFALWFLVSRLHGRSVDIVFPTPHIQKSIGDWIRKSCVHVLFDCHIGVEDPRTLEDLFENFPLLKDPVASEATFLPLSSILLSRESTPEAPRSHQEELSPTVVREFDTRMWRIELGQRKVGTATIILVMRWSSTPGWYSQTPHGVRDKVSLAKVKTLANKWLNVYFNSQGAEFQGQHIVCYAGFNIQTRVLPRLPSPDVPEVHGNVVEPSLQCFLHLKMFRGPVAAKQHLDRKHVSTEVHPGWLRCDLDIAGIQRKPWNTLPASLRNRIEQASGGRCPWARAGANCIQIRGETLHQHCNQNHGGEPYPFILTGEERKCGQHFLDPSELESHQLDMHARWPRHDYDPLVQRRKDYFFQHMLNRAQAMTKAITTDVMAAAKALVPGDDQERRPILISVGLDGFTCNVALFAEWLQAIKVPLKFVIVTERLATMTKKNFWSKDDKSFVAEFDSEILLQCMSDRIQTSHRYREIVDLWKTQQQAKDLHAAVLVPRNIT
ncbi:hypothetical protein ACN47E_007420 [Coniothyrium glycines]